MLILRPRPNRQPESLVANVLKSRLLHPSLDLVAWLRILAPGAAGATSDAVPFMLRVLGRERSILGIDGQIVLLEFGVAARLRRFETLKD